MSKKLQLRGGTTTEHASFTGAVREVTVDTDKDTLVIHDGSTAGGHILPRTKADIDALNIDSDTLDGKQLATIESEYQAFANTAVAGIVDSSPAALNTLNELAAALGDDANFATTTANSIGTKMPIAGGTFTGDITRGGTVISDGAISDTGTFTLDVTGNIILDADNSGSIHLKDNNVQYGSFYKSGNNLVQYNPISDGDIIFQGLDGASTINALILDMSDGGSATFNHDIKLADNGKLRLGAGSDLEMYHDGNSKITDVGAGNLEITTNGIIKLQKGNSEYMAQFNVDGAVQLYYDNAIKLATTSSGITVTGIVTTGGSSYQDGAITDTGTFTVDVAGVIILDADADGTIELKDAGAKYGVFYKSSSHFMVYNPISNGDIRLTGNDGGSVITALTLDMSAAGAAIFNNSVTATSFSGDGSGLTGVGASTTFGAVGTYYIGGWLLTNYTHIAGGSTVAGSGIYDEGSSGAVDRRPLKDYYGSRTLAGLSGTWRIMTGPIGNYPQDVNATLFVRIA